MKQFFAIAVFLCSTCLFSQNILIENMYGEQLLQWSFFKAAEIVSTDACKVEFSKVGMEDPGQVLLKEQFSIAIYTHGRTKYAAFTDCWEPRRIIFSDAWIEEEGYQALSIVIAHELYHLASCNTDRGTKRRSYFVYSKDGVIAKKKDVTRENFDNGMIIKAEEWFTRQAIDICSDAYFDVTIRTY